MTAKTNRRAVPHDAKRPRLDSHRGKPGSSHLCRALLQLCNGSRARAAVLWALTQAMREAAETAAWLEAEHGDLIESWGWQQAAYVYEVERVDRADDGALWVVKTHAEIARDARGAISPATVPKALRGLLDAGLVQRRRPTENLGIYAYRVDLAAVADTLRWARPCPWLLDVAAPKLDRAA